MVAAIFAVSVLSAFVRLCTAAQGNGNGTTDPTNGKVTRPGTYDFGIDTSPCGLVLQKRWYMWVGVTEAMSFLNFHFVYTRRLWLTDPIVLFEAIQHTDYVYA